MAINRIILTFILLSFSGCSDSTEFELLGYNAELTTKFNEYLDEVSIKRDSLKLVRKWDIEFQKDWLFKVNQASINLDDPPLVRTLSVDRSAIITGPYTLIPAQDFFGLSRFQK